MSEVKIDNIRAEDVGSESSESRSKTDLEKYSLEAEALESWRLQNESYRQDIRLRKKWADRVFWFTVVIIMFVFVVVVANGLCERMEVSDSVLIALISSVAVESIGITAIVARYLFKQ